MGDSTFEFEAHPGRGRFNATFFRVMDGYIDWHLPGQKASVYADLPETVVELGPGVGANFRYLRPGTTVIAIEPNPYMHRTLRTSAERYGVDIEIRDVIGERIDLPDASADAVISSLVLCTLPIPVGSCQRSAESCVLVDGSTFSNMSPPKTEHCRVACNEQSVGPGPGYSRGAPASEINRP